MAVSTGWKKAARKPARKPVRRSAAREGEDYGYGKFLESVDVLVMGRKTYEKVQSFGEWPFREKKVVVLSTSPVRIPDDLSASVSVVSASPDEVVDLLSAEGARHLYIDGGITIQRFLAAGMIDEITITRVPVLLGGGIPLFGPLDHDVALTHIDTRVYGNGFVQSLYRVENSRSESKKQENDRKADR